MKVLLVEDDPIVLMVYQYHLKKLGHITEIVNKGGDAIQKVIGVKKHLYDAMILDIGLPDMSGEYVLRCIRQHENTYSLNPLFIIVATAHSDQRKLSQCFLQGAAVFTKPMTARIFQQLFTPKLID